MKKFKKVLAAVLAGTMVVASMVCSAFATGDFKTTGTSVTLDDGGIRINIYNPWGKDDTHAVDSMANVDGAKAVTVTVKVTGMEKDGIKSFNMYLNGASNVDGNKVSYWEKDGAKKDGCQSTTVNVTADGEYKLTLTSDEAWKVGDNNFLMVGTDIDKDAWNALNGGEGDASLLAITAVTASADIPTGDNGATALILVAVAALAVVATVSVKKFAVER